MVGRVRRGLAAALLALLLAGCASFPDDGPRDWREKLENMGELGGPPVVPEPVPPSSEPGSGGTGGGPPPVVSGCVDPDPQVVATCLDPVGAIAVLPDGESALVGERATGRVLRVQQGVEPALVATVPVNASGGGGLTGLVLSPGYAEDQLLYAYISTPTDNRVVRIARGEPVKPILAGIPHGSVHNGGALAVDVDGSLLVATGDAGRDADPGSLAGKVLRIDTLGHPADGNPIATSPVLSSGLQDPAGMCVDPVRTTTWITDRRADADVLHLLVPGVLGAPAWSWPEHPGAAGCHAQGGQVAVAQTSAKAVYLLSYSGDAQFSGQPETALVEKYGQLGAAAAGPDGSTWLGTLNKLGGAPTSADDRVIQIRLSPANGANKV